jgi:DNA repair exonuclease SbcCD nuclease subunit
VPWLNPTNIEKGLEKIAKSKAKLLIGHLAINGFPMDSGKLCDTGLNSEVFKKFDMVLSGHFHHANEKGQIRYLGAPYQLTIADLHEKKGFHILDTDTLELEFIENPFEMFYKFIYDDRTEEAVAEIQKLDVSQFTDKYVRLVATHKENSVLYEQLIDKINNANPADFKTDEVCDLDVPESVDNEIGENIDITGEVDPTQNQTLAIIDKYIDSIGMEVDKEQLKRIMNELYAEASIGMVTI